MTFFFYFCLSLKCDEVTSYYQGIDEKEDTKRGYVLIDNYMVYNFTFDLKGMMAPFEWDIVRITSIFCHWPRSEKRTNEF